jgi:hypothetical protein
VSPSNYLQLAYFYAIQRIKTSVVTPTSSSSSSSMALQPRVGGLGLSYGFRDRYITMWVISPTINLVLVILIQPPDTSSGEATTDYITFFLISVISMVTLQL